MSVSHHLYQGETVEPYIVDEVTGVVSQVDCDVCALTLDMSPQDSWD